jgi:hypothetical protein
VIEVFKTNISKPKLAKEVRTKLLSHFPETRVNFDLDDCDKIFRVEGHHINIHKIMEVVIASGFVCEVLEE